ncbi:MAG: hypothetical protein K2G03_01030 [Bacilli bacterium]|nr:hypothetical protein [Bacilli bacterium]
MENTKSKYKKSAIFSVALALAIFTSSCGKYDNDVTVTMVEKKVEEEDLTSLVEQEELHLWALYDEESGMYRVDLDRFLREKLELANETLGNQDIINLVERVREELGDELYAKEWKDNELYNPDGKKVHIRAFNPRNLTVTFYVGEYPIEYDVDVDELGVTSGMSKEMIEGVYAFSKYYVIFDGDKEWTRAFSYREDKERYLAICLHEGSTFDKCTLSFNSDMAEATIKISDEEYEILHEIMLSYTESDDFYKFLSDNLDLLNKYLDLIKEKNNQYYEYLCDYINACIEQAEVLRYE